MVKTQSKQPLKDYFNNTILKVVFHSLGESGGPIADLRVGWRLGHTLKHLQNCALFQDFIFLLGHKTINSHLSFLLPWHGCYWGRDRSGFNCQCIKREFWYTGRFSRTCFFVKAMWSFLWKTVKYRSNYLHFNLNLNHKVNIIDYNYNFTRHFHLSTIFRQK